MTRELPVGIQNFEKLRRDGFAYVDKTAYVHQLAQSSVPYFLSRPRRFGKSLLVSTLKAYFEGKRGLFEGLAIERLEGDGPGAWQPRPVFHLDLNGSDYTREGALEQALDSRLVDWEDLWGVSRRDGSLGQRLGRVLARAHKSSGHRVAVLVDEYDKPLLDAMGDDGLVERNRATLRGFYSVLKKADEHLRFVLLTGVTKFSKVSIFSDLNQLRDVSLSEDYATVCGITEEELLGAFGPELGAMAARMGTDADGCLAALRAQYDGYCFHPDGPAAGGRVYNPFSLVCALQERRLGSYWFATGTPTFLARRMRNAEIDPRSLADGTIYAEAERLSDYRADDPDPVPMLFQAGYLTIRDHDPATGEYELGVPNAEVEWGLLRSLLPEWAPAYSRGNDVLALRRLVEAGDTDGMRDVIASLFASIPYTRADDPFENYFQAVLWLTLTLLGRYVSCEVRQAAGRVDCVIEARAHVYVIEFKRGGTAAEALAQIGERGYAAPFAADPRRLHLVGCAFDPRTRLLSEWEER